MKRVEFTKDWLCKNTRIEDGPLESQCWIWTRDLHGEGYGIFWRDGKNLRAHRIAFELFNGPIPDGREVHHECEVKACCNPGHLKPLTYLEHRHLHPRPIPGLGKTHCANGHEFTAETTRHKITRGIRQRYCIICRRASSAKYQLGYRARKKATADQTK